MEGQVEAEGGGGGVFGLLVKQQQWQVCLLCVCVVWKVDCWSSNGYGRYKYVLCVYILCVCLCMKSESLVKPLQSHPTHTPTATTPTKNHSDNDTLTTDPSTNTDPPTQPLSPAAQWQAVAKEEWWKTDAIKDDPNWWQRDREAFGTDPGSPLSGGSATANGGENSAPPGGGAGNGVGLGSTNGGAIGYGYTNRSSNGAMGGIGGIGGGIDGGASSDAAGGVGQLRETVKREAQYVVDSAMARLMAMRLALTRSARQKAFEKQVGGGCL